MRFTRRHGGGALGRGNSSNRTHRFAPVPPPDTATYGPELPEEANVQLVLNLALRVGEVLMSSGAGAADATATIYAVTRAYGLVYCEVDVIFTSITVSCHRGNANSPVTALRVVRRRGSDYTRLTDTENLVRRITAGRISVEDATAELERITNAPYPYSRWTATAAWGLMAASISVLIGGNGLTASFAAIVAVLIDRLGRWLNNRSLPFFFQQLIGGLVATSIALGLVATNAYPTLQQSPSLIVAASITVLLSGLSVVGAVQDAVTGYNVTAAGRATEIALMSAGLIAGVLLALKLGVELGVIHSGVKPAVPASALSLPIKIVAGAATAASFALASYATTRALLVSGAAGALGAGVYYGVALFGVQPITSAALAAIVIGLAGGVMSRRLRIPPVVVAVSGLTPLLPGLSTYQGLAGLAGRHSAEGLTQLTTAIGIALALGAGVVFGEYLGQPVRTGLGRLERRLAGPRMAGPLHTPHLPRRASGGDGGHGSPS